MAHQQADFWSRLSAYFWSPPLAKPTVHINPRRIYVLPTRGGFLFFMAIISMLIASINYSLALGFAMVFLLFALGMVGLLYTAANLWGLTLQSGRATAVFCGEIAHFPIYLINQRPQSRPDIQLTFRLRRKSLFAWPPLQLLPEQGDLINTGVSTAIVAQGQNCVHLPLTAHRRGRLRLPTLSVATRFPLGLVRAWSYAALQSECLVYPLPLAWPLQHSGSDSTLGNIAGEQGDDDFAGLRERQPAESLRHVDWKSVARQGEERPLLVKHFSGGTQTTSWLNWASLPNMDTEKRLSIITGWVLALAEKGQRYGLILPGVRVEPNVGEPHKLHCLELLALFNE